MDTKNRLYIDMVKSEMEEKLATDQEMKDNFFAQAAYIETVIQRLVLTGEPKIVETTKAYFNEQQELKKETEKITKEMQKKIKDNVDKYGENIKEMFEEIKKL